VATAWRERRENALDGLRDDFLGEVVGGNVAPDRDGVSTSLLDLLNDGLSLDCKKNGSIHDEKGRRGRKRTFVKIGDNDLRSLLGEEDSGRPSDALSGSSDNRDLSSEQAGRGGVGEVGRDGGEALTSRTGLSVGAVRRSRSVGRHCAAFVGVSGRRKRSEWGGGTVGRRANAGMVEKSEVSV
jgi:hypothetical protein